MFTLTSKQHAVLAWDNELNASDTTHGPLMARAKSGADRNGVLQPLTFVERGRADGRSVEVRADGVVNALMTPNGGRSGTGPGDAVIAFGWQNSPAQGDSVSGEITPTLCKSKVPGVVCATGDVTHALCAGGCSASEDGTGRGTPIVVPTLTAAMWKGPGHNRDELTMPQAGRPRRLTPRECERLMSWPDDWTAVGVDDAGRQYRLSDTARYRLCGNGVGSVCVEWFARRLAHEHALAEYL